MATQPNIEHEDADLPRGSLPLPPSRRWAVESKPGVVRAPDDVPRGSAFGTPGPDTGWALRIIRLTDGDEHPARVRTLLAALMGARAAAFGRGPIREDLDVAKVLCGIGEGLPGHLSERRERWVRSLRHASRPGQDALAEIDEDLLEMAPDEVRRAVTLRRPSV